MKKLVFFISLLLVFTIRTNSQPQEKAFHPNFENLKLELNLTDTQAEKFESLFKQKMAEIKSVRDFFKEDRSAARDKMIELNDKYNKIFSEILDAEQLEKFDQIMQDRREDREDRPRKRNRH